MEEVTIENIVEKIIASAFKVSNALGIGFEVKVYENALSHQMSQDGLTVVQQSPIKIAYDGVTVGEFSADILVEERVMVEIKAVPESTSEQLAQALNHLRVSGLGACLLINFGKSRIQINRFYY
jgi:GxxExxY protein